DVVVARVVVVLVDAVDVVVGRVIVVVGAVNVVVVVVMVVVDGGSVVVVSGSMVVVVDSVIEVVVDASEVVVVVVWNVGHGSPGGRGTQTRRTRSTSVRRGLPAVVADRRSGLMPARLPFARVATVRGLSSP